MNDIMIRCQKAGCGAEFVGPAHRAVTEKWHRADLAEDPRNGHNVNALDLCPACWSVCLSIGFTL